jgi:hypothetical protein
MVAASAHGGTLSRHSISIPAPPYVVEPTLHVQLYRFHLHEFSFARSPFPLRQTFPFACHQRRIGQGLEEQSHGDLGGTTFAFYRTGKGAQQTHGVVAALSRQSRKLPASRRSLTWDHGLEMA